MNAFSTQSNYNLRSLFILSNFVQIKVVVFSSLKLLYAFVAVYICYSDLQQHLTFMHGYVH